MFRILTVVASNPVIDANAAREMINTTQVLNTLAGLHVKYYGQNESYVHQGSCEDACEYEVGYR